MCRAIRILSRNFQAFSKQVLGLLMWSLALGLTLTGTPLRADESGPTGENDLAYVNDYAQIIEPSTERKIAEIAAELDRKTGTRLVVVTIPSLEGTPVEEFTKELMASWQPLGVDKSKVVLLLDAVAEQKIRIELGAGMDSLISNETSQRVRQQVMLPNLRLGNRAEAYYLAVTELATAIAQEKGIALYTVLGPGFLRNMPAVLTLEKESEPSILSTLAIIFVPVFIIIFWLMRKQFSYGKYLIGDQGPVVGGEKLFPDHKIRGDLSKFEKSPDEDKADS